MIKPIVLEHKFKIPVFKAKVSIIIGNTIKAAFDYAEDKTSEVICKAGDEKSIRAYTYAFCNDEGKIRAMLFFRWNAKPGEVAHEVKHLINMMFKWFGYNLSLTNDELECYYLDDLVNKVHGCLDRYKKLYKKPKPKKLKEKEPNAILS